MAVDLVAHLLAVVADDGVWLPAHGPAHQVRQEAVQLDGAVPRTRETAAAEHAGLQPEVAAVFLSHDVRSHLAGAEQAVQAAIDATGLVDTTPVLGIGVI